MLVTGIHTGTYCDENQEVVARGSQCKCEVMRRNERTRRRNMIRFKQKIPFERLYLRLVSRRAYSHLKALKKTILKTRKGKKTMYCKTENYFKMWKDDRDSILYTMIRNMTSDLENGYNYFGNSITKQRKEIEAYKAETENTIEKIKTMPDENAVNHWCYYDLIKVGAIEV